MALISHSVAVTAASQNNLTRMLFVLSKNATKVTVALRTSIYDGMDTYCSTKFVSEILMYALGSPAGSSA